MTWPNFAHGGTEAAPPTMAGGPHRFMVVGLAPADRLGYDCSDSHFSIAVRSATPMLEVAVIIGEADGDG
jgi:hypothetical protein